MISKSKVVAFTATSDPDKAREFYQQTLGLDLIEETPFAIVFDSNGITVRVQKAERVHPAPYTLIGWEVDDITSTMAELASRGVEFERYAQLEQDQAGIWKVPDGTRVAWFKDPDGNLLSLAENA